MGRILQACDPNSPENGPGRVGNRAEFTRSPNIPTNFTSVCEQIPIVYDHSIGPVLHKKISEPFISNVCVGKTGIEL